MMTSDFTKHNVGVAAEAFAAGVLAHAGYDVSIQYGANRPGYDIVAIKNGRTWRVSIKGSQDNGWVLAAGHKKGKSYHAAIDAWLDRQRDVDVFLLVQFYSVKVGSMPWVYVATPEEIALALKARANGRGETVLAVDHTFVRKGIRDRIPEDWLFTNRHDLPIRQSLNLISAAGSLKEPILE